MDTAATWTLLSHARCCRMDDTAFTWTLQSREHCCRTDTAVTWTWTLLSHGWTMQTHGHCSHMHPAVTWTLLSRGHSSHIDTAPKPATNYTNPIRTTFNPPPSPASTCTRASSPPWSHVGLQTLRDSARGQICVHKWQRRHASIAAAAPGTQRTCPFGRGVKTPSRPAVPSSSTHGKPAAEHGQRPCSGSPRALSVIMRGACVRNTRTSTTPKPATNNTNPIRTTFKPPPSPASTCTLASSPPWSHAGLQTLRSIFPRNCRTCTQTYAVGARARRQDYQHLSQTRPGLTSPAEAPPSERAHPPPRPISANISKQACATA